MNYDSDLEDSYFRLLAKFIKHEGQDDLLEILHDTPFVWLVTNDVNRAEDGRELRLSLLRDLGVPEREISIFDEKDITVLEVLAALAQRASMMFDDHEMAIHDWFETFIFNLEIEGEPNRTVVEDVLANWMQRNIDYDGVGGLFPLTNPEVDQRETEIWYQMSAYIIEEMESKGFLS